MARLNDYHLSCDIHKVHTYPTQALSVRLWWCHTFSLLGDVLMSKVCLLNIRFFHLSRISRKEMFSQRFSPTTGKMEWVVEDEDYDMRDEIARWSLDLKYSRGVCITICQILLCDFLFHSQVSLYRHASRWWKGRKSLMICDRLPKCICKFKHMGATSEYPATHALFKSTAPVVRGP